MMSGKPELSRRDFIKITAVAGSALVGGKLVSGLLGDGSQVIVKETRIMMGTIINLAVVAESLDLAKTAIAGTFAEMGRQIAIFDQRSTRSPVATLNRNCVLDNPPVELLSVLDQAIAISEMTNGAFDVTVKPLMDLYQGPGPNLPEDSQVQETLALVDYKGLSVSSAKIEVSKPGMSITVDGIAKGYIVDAGVAELKRQGFPNVFVEAGGDLMASGTKGADAPWKVGVQSPRKGQDTIASFTVRDQAVATSGDYVQYFTPDRAHHHILDPRTGYSPPELASVTLVAPTCLQADALATAVTVLGKSGLAFIDALPGVEALLVAKDLQEYQSAGFGTS